MMTLNRWAPFEAYIWCTMPIRYFKVEAAIKECGQNGTTVFEHGEYNITRQAIYYSVLCVVSLIEL